MRARNLKPGFFKNEVLCSLPPLTRLLFAGLWSMADREGRLEDRPERIKIEILPYDRCNVDTMLDALAEAKDQRGRSLIRRYGPGYIDIPCFLDHQNPHPNEKPSILPAYSDIVTLREDSIAKTEVIGLNPSSLNPSSLHTEPPPTPPTGGDDFDRFWKQYPKRKDKGHARKAWGKALKKADADTIIAGLTQQLPELKEKEAQYVPLAATWLNGERWTDEPDKKAQTSSRRSWGETDEEMAERTRPGVPLPKEFLDMVKNFGKGIE